MTVLPTARQDAEHVKGIYRRTTLEEYRKPEPAWELVLDLDALGLAEGKSWVWKGTALLDEGPGTEPGLVRGGRGARLVPAGGGSGAAPTPAPSAHR
jgi:prolyl oligopeptidase PreP (S9A serine peptidase family)